MQPSDVSTPKVNPVSLEWTEALVMDLALGTSEELVLDTYGLQWHQLQALKRHPAFDAQLRATRAEMQKSGVTFQMKARAQADALLDTTWAIIHSATTPANVKAQLIQNTVRWAGYEQKADEGNGARSGFTINIHLNPSANAVLDTGTTIEQKP